MNKHTPGPWLTKGGYDKDSGLGLTRVMFGSSIVSECYGINSEANARLIAAAPDMLEALREFVSTMDSLPASDETHSRVWGTYHTARAAIAKAEGAL